MYNWFDIVSRTNNNKLNMNIYSDYKVTEIIIDDDNDDNLITIELAKQITDKMVNILIENLYVFGNSFCPCQRNHFDVYWISKFYK